MMHFVQTFLIYACLSDLRSYETKFHPVFDVIAVNGNIFRTIRIQTVLLLIGCFVGSPHFHCAKGGQVLRRLSHPQMPDFPPKIK